MSTEQETPEALVRIRVPLDAAAAAEPDDDWLWAEPLGSGRFRIESCAFFAYGVSRDDVVLASPPPGDESPRLEDVVEKSGHRTLRAALDPSADVTHPRVQDLLGRLLEMGCTHETLRPKLLAVDVPPAVDVEAAVRILQDLASDGLLLWEWADPRPC